jgi:hypothetical protein
VVEAKEWADAMVGKANQGLGHDGSPDLVAGDSSNSMHTKKGDEPLSTKIDTPLQSIFTIGRT